MDLYGWILLIGLCTIVAIGLWYKDWKLEKFQVPTGLAESMLEPLEWVQSTLDKAARIGNTCGVLEEFPDEEMSDAVVQIMDPLCESGLPHTVGTDRIRIPKPAWNSTAEFRAAVLRHERIHLLQRRDPRRWSEFYKNEWGYTTHVDPPKDIESAAIRANPDTFPDRWCCWRNRYWFVPIYRSMTAPTLKGTDTRIWDSVKKEWLDTPPYEWRVQFCTEKGMCPFQSEHPAEISAEYATMMDRWETPAAIRLRRFLEKK